MFVVKRVLKRGFFRDRVVIAATKNASLSRSRLGWDLLQAPDLKTDTLKISQGEELIFSLAHNSVNEGQAISVVDVKNKSAFNRLWRRAGA